MTKKTYAIVPTLISLALIAGCGKSPLLHHETQTRKAATPAVPTVTGALPATPQTTEDNTPPEPTPGPAACTLSFPKEGLCASLTWDAALTDDGENSFVLRFWAAGTEQFQDVDGSVNIQLWMPDMNHGSSPVTVTAKGNGIYEASRVYFVMPGDWDVRVQIKRNKKIVEQAVLSVHL